MKGPDRSYFIPHPAPIILPAVGPSLLFRALPELGPEPAQPELIVLGCAGILTGGIVFLAGTFDRERAKKWL